MIGIANLGSSRALRTVMGALALAGVVAAVPASARPWHHHHHHMMHHHHHRG